MRKGKDYNELPIEKKRAIKLSERVSERLVEDIPEIADDYRRRGYSALEIVEEFEIENTYNVNKNSAMMAVYYALRRLIPTQELKQIAHEHHVASGYDACYKRRGIHNQDYKISWSDEEREFILSRARDPQYMSVSKRNLKLIKEEYDKNFNNERTLKSIEVFINRLKKQGLID